MKPNINARFELMRSVISPEDSSTIRQTINGVMTPPLYGGPTDEMKQFALRWNMCIGISDAEMENIDMLGDNLPSRIKLLKTEADGGYALLKEVLKSAELGELIPSPGNGTDLVDRIRAFVNGGV